MTMRNMIIVLAASAILGGCTSAMEKHMETGAKPLTGAELKALYAEEVNMTWKNPRGASGTAVRRPDGTQSVDWGSGSDTGKWWVEDDQLCQQWTTARGGKRYCITVFRTGEDTYRGFNSDGSISSDGKHM